ncbi:MAG TPA: DUF1214 domain-containing protein [Acidimicrobiales bacterium]|nr:DUF1214 domain-containing protein [Acidimicrobiales bacterium]
MSGGPEGDGVDELAWLPWSVGGAARKGTLGAGSLYSGEAWGLFLDALGEAGAFLHSDRVPAGPEGVAEGYRHLMVLLALGIDEALRTADPYDPVIQPGNVDNVMKWGMDCPDALYAGCSVRPDATYRVWGTRGDARFVAFQVMAGIGNAGDVVADDLELGPDGEFELYLSADKHEGNWLPLTEGASSFVIRQFFYDWVAEKPATFHVECLSRHDAAAEPAPDPAERTARQLAALGAFVRESLRFWWDVEEGGRAQGMNAFRPPVVRSDIGGATDNVTVWGSWELQDDEALVVEMRPPPALYWSVSFGNQWWESIDYARHQSSLNGHQAVLDDGVFRAVVAHRDPGVANWLDTAGNRRGAAIVRWVRADEAPVPTTTVVPFDALDSVLPASTPRVTTAERRRGLDARLAGVRKRFPR